MLARELQIIENSVRRYFHSWEWKEIQSHFILYRNWKYKHISRWSYPAYSEAWRGSTDIIWNDTLDALLDGQWKTKWT